MVMVEPTIMVVVVAAIPAALFFFCFFFSKNLCYEKVASFS